MKSIIQTSHAPQAIGPYSQAVKVNNLVFLSGQIPLDPHTMLIVSDDIRLQTEQVFKNIRSVCEEAGGGLDSIVKLTIYLTDLADFQMVNEVMEQFFKAPYPARATIQVSALPKSSKVEIDAILII